jgi:two-component system, cell cycle sensor histidine kinase and response regulator CckA
MNSSESDQHQEEVMHSVEAPTSRSPTNRTKPNKTLLIVDDNPMFRTLVVTFLTGEGYTVLQAEGATEALRLATTAGTIHLLITDLAMPEIDGLELTRRFRVTHPMIPVLMVSGSMFTLPHAFKVDLDRFELLEKPFHLSELLHKVRSLLGEGPLPD